MIRYSTFRATDEVRACPSCGRRYNLLYTRYCHKCGVRL